MGVHLWGGQHCGKDFAKHLGQTGGHRCGNKNQERERPLECQEPLGELGNLREAMELTQGIELGFGGQLSWRI